MNFHRQGVNTYLLCNIVKESSHSFCYRSASLLSMKQKAPKIGQIQRQLRSLSSMI